MWNVFHRLAGAVLAALCLAGATHAQTAGVSRSLTVDDLLGLEAFGRASISPDGRWAVYEKRAGYDTMPRVESNGRSTWSIMEVWLVDLGDPNSAPVRLLPGEGLGLQLVGWSPSGKRMLITRLRGDAFEYGVVTLSDRAVRWTGLTPDLPLGGATAQWASDETIIAAVRPDGSLPLVLGYDRTSMRRRVEAWNRTALGQEPSRTVIEAQDGVMTTEAPEPTQALVQLNAGTGEAEVLAEGLIADFALSPDGGTVALVRRRELMAIGDPELLHMEDDRRRRLAFVDLESRAITPELTHLDIAPHLLRWSPDSKRVLFWGRRDGRRWDRGSLMSVGAAEGVETFSCDGLEVGSSASVVVAGVQADWLGRAPVLHARASGSERRDWYLLSLGRAPIALTTSLVAAPARIAAATTDRLYVFADGRYWAMSDAGVQPLSDTDQRIRETVLFDLTMGRRLKSNEAPRRKWSLAIDAEGQLLMMNGERSSRLGQGGALDDRTLALSDRAALSLRPTGLADTLVNQSSGRTQAIDGVNAALADVVMTEAEAVKHPDLDGRETTSWVFLPKRPGDVRGVIVGPYPGWADNLARLDPLTMTYSFRPEVFVAAGYAVVSPSVPGDLPVRERGDAYARSVDLAIDAVLAAMPELPADRMVLWGHSFGGYAALEIAVRSSRYRSYIASSAYSDMLGVWGEFDAIGRIQPENGMFFRFNQGWTETGQGALGAPPWLAPDDYAATSPFLRADRITRPILFLTADLDFTPMTQAERMFSAILRNGGEARLVTYWGEKHLTWSPANIRDRYKQIFDWLAYTLDDSSEVSTVETGALPRSEPSPRTPPP
ncbi:S9 family peptidase [Brevundimonas aurantiaca]|jgi:dipeptidyl aminopeptidase/acylaminoacyl peptidase|uniref:Dipeptidyl aminopeptidase/acylaminoacyl peptidase n=1 Tax=Brevundimonas aurantiaca TaxID=74316 RepID=A0A7W9C8G9_9CAUL|nr:prolyl oligopeptidase family serine peptidase [Brevundimonas aurantiaca]MBB5740796.1 dipeptidyl aminopeptidase/acylaminoacyl peptidase [Brevundimonas aurantiaca]